jgi:hypothetical protein
MRLSICRKCRERREHKKSRKLRECRKRWECGEWRETLNGRLVRLAAYRCTGSRPHHHGRRPAYRFEDGGTSAVLDHDFLLYQRWKASSDGWMGFGGRRTMRDTFPPTVYGTRFRTGLYACQRYRGMRTGRYNRPAERVSIWDPRIPSIVHSIECLMFP